MRQIFSRHGHLMAQVIRRLDDAARAMNPLLAFVIIALLILNFACAVNLIDWGSLPATPAPLASPSQSAASALATSPSAAPGGHIAAPSD